MVEGASDELLAPEERVRSDSGKGAWPISSGTLWLRTPISPTKNFDGSKSLVGAQAIPSRLC